MDVKKEKPNPKMTIGCSQKQKVMDCVLFNNSSLFTF